MDSLNTAHLFRIIQSFLDQKDYLAFMNCNHGMFYNIKRETIQYHIDWSNSLSTARVGESFVILNQMIQKVDCPSKQLSISISNLPDLTLDVLYTIRFMSPYLHKLFIETPNSLIFHNDFDFSIFNNIAKVSLYGFNGITRINTGLQNIEHLTLCLTNLLNIYDVGTSNPSLKTLSLIPECKLDHLPIATNFHDEYEILKRELNLWRSIGLDFSFSMESKLFNIRFLDLTGPFPRTRFPLDCICHIEHVELNNPSITLPLLPVFKGKILVIRGFNITQWSAELELDNLRSLRVVDCYTAASLPSLPSLRFLNISSNKHLKELRTFPRCDTMRIVLLSSLMKVYPQPRLYDLTINACKNLKDYTAFNGKNLRSLTLVGEYDNLHWTRNVCSLSLCDSDRSLLEGLNSGDIPMQTKSFHIERTENINLSPLSNAYSITVFQSEVIGHLSNIHHLEIRNCSEFLSSENLENITGRLCISRCRNLRNLKNLNGTPLIALSHLLSVLDFSGLGRNEHVYIFHVPHLELAAIRYARDKRASREESNPFHDIFRTVKAFSIIKERDSEAEYGDNYPFDQPRFNFEFSWNRLHDYKKEQLW